MPDIIVSMILVSDWLRRLLGMTREVAENIDKAQLYLAGGWTIRTVIFVMAAGFVWFGYLYLRDGKRPSLWLKVPLLLLRLIALAALAIMLLQPMLRLNHSSRVRSSVIVMVDNSLSMAKRDERLPSDLRTREARGANEDPSRLTRAEVLEKIVNLPSVNLISTLSKNYNVHLYKFSGIANPVALPASIGGTKDVSSSNPAYQLKDTPDSVRGNSTRMGDALNRALDDVAGQPVSGALILSDGGSNLGDDPVSVAEKAHEQGVKASTLGIGDPTPTRDLAITEALADQVVRKDNIVQVFAGLSHRGYQGRTISVTLRRGAETIGTKSVTLGPDTRKQTVSFTYIPKESGTFTYTISASQLDGESTYANNRRSFLQRVVTKQLRILYVEGEPRWEYRYLKNAVLRDTQIAFACLLVSGGQPGGEGNIKIDRFPDDEAGLFDYDILILGDVPRSYFSPSQLLNIRRFVEDKGASLIVIAGEKHMPSEYRDTPVEAILPVVLPPQPEQVTTDEPFQWELTAAGRQDPLLRLDDDPTRNAQIWSQLPGMFWNAGATRAKPGATVLAVNPARQNSFGKRVILAVQSYGAGRCLISLTDSMWRWRWKVGDRYFYRYWGQAIRAMTPHEPAGGNRFAQINADRSDYLIGDRVSLHARLLDNFYRPVKEKQITVSIKNDSGYSTNLVMNAMPGSPGLFNADMLADRIGKFEAFAASPADPTAKAKATFLVQSIALESQQPEMNEKLLKRVAASGGGSYYQADEIKKWLASLKANDQIIKSESEVELWDAPLLLLLFIVPLGTEWIARKRSGML